MVANVESMCLKLVFGCGERKVVDEVGAAMTATAGEAFGIGCIVALDGASCACDELTSTFEAILACLDASTQRVSRRRIFRSCSVSEAERGLRCRCANPATLHDPAGLCGVAGLGGRCVSFAFALPKSGRFS